MNSDLLQQLKGLELPPEPPLWPPAPGWWLVFAVVASVTTWAILRLLQRHALERPRRAASAELALLRQGFGNAELTAATYIDGVNELLKRVLRRYQPDNAAITAFGDGWLTYLDEVSGTESYRNGPGRVLGFARYQRHIDTDWHAFDALIDKTLRRIGQ